MRCGAERAEAVGRARRKLPAKVGGALTAQQYREAEELGILVDKDDQARPASGLGLGFRVVTLGLPPERLIQSRSLFRDLSSA